jgi:nitrate/TMAO reductase-like tetraheme cytochrome c subunit
VEIKAVNTEKRRKNEKFKMRINGRLSTMKISGFLIFILFAGFLLLMTNASASENSCIDCHKTLTPFLAEQQRFNEIRIQHLERNVFCSLECHADRVRQLATANYEQWSESLHAVNNVTCDKCHGGDPKQATKEKAHVGITNITEPDSPVYYTNVPQTCGNCHSKELTSFQSSKHYQKLEALKLAPTCTTCHIPHQFTVMNPDDFVSVCGNCHSVTKKIADYQVPLQAEEMMSNLNKLKYNIEVVKQDIFWAKRNGTDVTQAEQYADNALNTLGNLAPMWHEFNLTHFGDEINSANKDVRMAEAIVKPTPGPTSEKTKAPGLPGFEGFAGVSSAVAVLYLLSRKQN